ncbi:TPA: DUF4406 domain-containing protein [Salmonella enterica]|nr:DUF4406 domain-containing protein [Salmonella enterica]
MSVIFISSPSPKVSRCKALSRLTDIIINETVNKLTAKGHTVLVPELPDDIPDEMRMAICSSILPGADEIYLLDDWQYSPAARAEYALAKKLGLKISTPTSRKRSASC